MFRSVTDCLIIQLHIDETLSAVVFGEATLNDAISIVLFNLFSSLRSIGPEVIEAFWFYSHTAQTNLGAIAGLAVAKFIIVAITGLLIGALHGCVCAFITRFTAHTPVVEPIFVGTLYLASQIC